MFGRFHNYFGQWRQTLGRLRQVLTLLKRHHLRLNAEECRLFRSHVKYGRTSWRRENVCQNLRAVFLALNETRRQAIHFNLCGLSTVQTDSTSPNSTLSLKSTSSKIWVLLIDLMGLLTNHSWGRKTHFGDPRLCNKMEQFIYSLTRFAIVLVHRGKSFPIGRSRDSKSAEQKRTSLRRSQTHLKTAIRGC